MEGVSPAMCHTPPGGCLPSYEVPPHGGPLSPYSILKCPLSPDTPHEAAVAVLQKGRGGEGGYLPQGDVPPIGVPAPVGGTPCQSGLQLVVWRSARGRNGG